MLSGDITVTVQVSNFNVVNKLGQVNAPGQGHIHYYMDVAAPSTPGQPAVTAPGTYAATTDTSYTWKNVGPGTHYFLAQLVNNDHTPLIPVVVAKVTVTVPPPPTLSITAPADGSTVPAGDITVKVQLQNFSIVNKLGQANVPGQGHIHYYMDVAAPSTPGQPAVTAPGTYAATADTSYAWKNVAPGTHTFLAQLVNNDHTPLIPLVAAKVTVTVQGAPALTIVSPTDGSTVPAGDITVTVKVSNFNVVNSLGQANVPGAGHIHYYLDVAAPTTPGQPAVTAAGTYSASAGLSYMWTSVAPGMHTLYAQLVNNDHTPLIPLVIAKVTITAQAAAAAPPEVTQYAKDWPLPMRDYSNTRATSDSTINSGNVKTLAPVWAAPVPGVGLFGSAATNPIITGNTVYFQDLGNNVFAVDRATGAIRWSKMYNETNIGPNGVAVGWGKVFASADPYNIVALDMATGNELWRSQISNVPTNGTDIQPTVYGGLVFTSTVPGSSAADFYSGGGIGTIYALDQATGKIVWSFDTVDSKNIWGNPTVNSGGGAWYPPAITPDGKSMFWGIANPAPWPPSTLSPNGSTRPGPNLYTDSIVSLGLADGKLNWYTQVLPHDLFDWDFMIPPILTNANINGKQQDIVIGAGKWGRVVAFNRQTGAILWEAIVGQHQNDQMAALPTDGSTVTVLPGAYGGVETPMAYANGVLYVPVDNLAYDYTISSGKAHPFKEGTGELTAIQVDTGKILWNKTFNSLNVGGATVVNDLVFTATYDGMLYAFNRATGDQVWSYKAPGGVNAWPAFAGDTMVLPVGLGSFPALIAFKLGATAPVLSIKPADGTSVVAGDIAVSALALNFNLVSKLGQTNAAGEGHLHYFLDTSVPTAPGQPAVTAPGTYAATADTSYMWKNVAPGPHTFAVELVNNDHTPLVPPVIVKATVTVTPPTPTIKITTPLNRSTVPPGDVTITVQVSNFSVVDKLGQPSALGEGHIHYFMDVPAPTAAGKPAVTASGTYAATTATSYTWHNVAAGAHQFFAELVNNDHTPLVPPVVAEVVVVASTSGGGGP